jgi:hypothetical protein
MAKGRATADILAEWREVERLAEHTKDPFERAEFLRRARKLRSEYAQVVDDLSDVAGHGERSRQVDHGPGQDERPKS